MRKLARAQTHTGFGRTIAACGLILITSVGASALPVSRKLNFPKTEHKQKPPPKVNIRAALRAVTGGGINSILCDEYKPGYLDRLVTLKRTIIGTGTCSDCWELLRFSVDELVAEKKSISDALEFSSESVRFVILSSVFNNSINLKRVYHSEYRKTCTDYLNVLSSLGYADFSAGLLEWIMEKGSKNESLYHLLARHMKECDSPDASGKDKNGDAEHKNKKEKR